MKSKKKRKKKKTKRNVDIIGNSFTPAYANSNLFFLPPYALQKFHVFVVFFFEFIGEEASRVDSEANR